MNTDDINTNYTDRTVPVINMLKTPSGLLTSRLLSRKEPSDLLPNAVAYLTEHPEVRILSDGFGSGAHWWWGAPAQTGIIPADVHLAVTLALAVNEGMRNLIDPVDWTA